MNKKKHLSLIAVPILILAGGLIWNEGPGQRWELEGLYFDKNVRDTGSSLNACLTEQGKEPLFQEGVLIRSNKWFSGWSCSSVHNPEEIISFNYQPKRQREYFCWQNFEKIVGRYDPAPVEINDIENLSTWEDEHQREAICKDLAMAFASIGSGKRTLIHCDAGRDRTGAVIGILAGVAAEVAFGSMSPELIDAVECDYQKSASLNKVKYGRLHRFLSDIKNSHGGMISFLTKYCTISPLELERASNKILKQ